MELEEQESSVPWELIEQCAPIQVDVPLEETDVTDLEKKAADKGIHGKFRHWILTIWDPDIVAMG